MKATFRFNMIVIVLATLVLNSCGRRTPVTTNIKDEVTTVIFHEGPGEEYPETGQLTGGSNITVVDAAQYHMGWVRVSSYPEQVGYVPAEVLVDNGYLECLESIAPVKVNSISGINERVTNFFHSFFRSYIGSGISALIFSALILLAAVAIAIGIRFLDGNFRMPWIHYMLYLIVLVPAWGLCSLTERCMTYINLSDSISLSLLAAAAMILAIRGGIGIRQCGMTEGKYHKNANRQIGEFLLFPIWMIAICIVWNVSVTPLLKWVTFVRYSNDILLIIIALLAEAAVLFLILWTIWEKVVIPYCLRPVGIIPLHIMTLALCWAQFKLTYMWADENLFGAGGLIFIIASIGMAIYFLWKSLTRIEARRCRMCHNYHGEATGKIDLETKYETEEHRESCKKKDIDMSITKTRKISDTEKVFQDTIEVRNWKTEHTCPECGDKWFSFHSSRNVVDSKHVGWRWKEKIDNR